MVESVAASRRYRHVCPDTVRRLSRQALEIRPGDVAGAAKRTKRALHQAFGAYLPVAPRYARLLGRLDRAIERDGVDCEPVRAFLRETMALHASTRERLPVLERFQSELSRRWGRPRRLLDVGCGLNPLALPWMGLPDDAVYAGVEIDRALVEFLRAVLDRLGAAHDLRVGDLLAPLDLPEADVALALKLLPTLEQQRAGAGAELLFSLPAPVVVASFPRRSLGGRGKGIDATYTRGFEQLLARRGARAERIELPGELVYVVDNSA